MLVDDLTLTTKLGEGSFGNVYLTTKQGTSTKYATKVIDKAKNQYLIEYINNEISILKDVNHPNIIKFIEKHEDSNNIYIVEEFDNGVDLFQALKRYQNGNDKGFPEEIVQYIMKEIIEGVKYLHNKRIIHRQISLDNIMINYENEDDLKNNNIMKGKIKIIDFSIASYLKKGELSNLLAGIRPYMSPIMFVKDKDIEYDEKEDIWTLGTTCYILLTGKFPFAHKNRENYYVPTTLSKEAISFLNCMLQYDSKKRLNAHSLCNHAFLRKNIKEFNNIDLTKLKNITIEENSKILINTKENENIRENFGI
jgi:serine/threonine protein kinase